MPDPLLTALLTVIDYTSKYFEVSRLQKALIIHNYNTYENYIFLTWYTKNSIQ